MTHVGWKYQILNNALTSKHIYTVVKNNRYNIRKVLTEDKSITFDNKLSSDETTENTDNEENEEKINFNITLSVEE